MIAPKQQQEGTEPQDATGETPQASVARKKFVEPSISHPIDVLEATTFFQAVESGITGFLPAKADGDKK